jgi:hypothetical protein
MGLESSMSKRIGKIGFFPVSVVTGLAAAVAAWQILGVGCMPADQPAASMDVVELTGPGANAQRPDLITVTALSEHYVEVAFSTPIGDAELAPSGYQITGEDGSSLPVVEARRRADATKVLLVTATQKPIRYQLTILDSIASKRSSREQSNGSGSFSGSSTQEPFLATAISLSNTEVLLTFSEDMDQTSAETAAFYSISPTLAVSSAVLLADDSDPTTVVLTTTTQANVVYTVKVTNVKNDTNGLLINPFQNTTTFQGIPPVDQTAPEVAGAVSTASTQVRVSFSEPVDTAADDPINYSISPLLTVTGAQRNVHNTQVLLTTLPQVAGLEYTVTANNVRDFAVPLGNVINPAANTAMFTFVGEPGIADGTQIPRVVGAVSTDNMTVRVTFSKPMTDSAENPDNYSIVQASEDGEAAKLFVQSAAFVPSTGQTVVELTTLGQAEVLYRLRVVNVTDLAGNHLGPATLLADPAETTFAGIPPVEGVLVTDTDGDGFADWFEMVGWEITVVFANGEQSTTLVTSDPFNPDTDGDGILDGDENRRSMDPRTDDTDADQVGDWDEVFVWHSDPNNQDTDGDGMDDKKEIVFAKTSPILDDTDGDGFTDSQELFEFNRNPRIADLPRPDITVGNMRLQLDERFSFTDETGQTITQESSTSTTLERSEESGFSNSDTDVTGNSQEWFINGGVELEFDKSFVPKVTVNVEGGYSSESHSEHTHQFTTESSRSSQEAFESSLSKGLEISTTSSVSREIVGASVDVDLTIVNAGDIAFSISNLEISALQPTGLSLTDFLPVATLLPSSALITGETPIFNLGPFNEELGPFIFQNRDVFPNLVEELMRSPKGLLFKLANYDITDEFGRNFAFAGQAARDRTSGITIDFGDGTTETFFVATSGAIDDKFVFEGTCSDNPSTMCDDDGDCAGSCEPQVLGGFGDRGDPVPIPLEYALQDILGLPKNPTANDAILAGPDGVADSIAVGDDVQIIPLGTAGLLDTDIVIDAGQDGILESSADNDDSQAVTAGYETSETCSASTPSRIRDGGNGVSETTANPDSDDVQVVPDGAAVAAGGIVVGPGGDGLIDTLPGGDDILITPGETCEVDADCDTGACDGGEALVRIKNRKRGDFNRIWAVFMSGDNPTGADFDRIVLSPGTDIALAFVQDIDRDGVLAREEFVFGSSDRDDDSDNDGIDDFAEIRVGWDIGVVGQEIAHVNPDPRVPDGDGDGLEDLEEQDLRRLFGAGGKLQRCQGGDDVDLACSSDESCKPVEVAPEEVCEEDGDCSGGDICVNLRCSTPQTCAEDASGPEIEDVFGPGSADSIISSDPRLADTDQDGVSDMDEIAGFNIGVAVIDGGNNRGNTQALGDDIQLVLLGSVVGNTGVVILPGPNGEIDSVPDGDDTLDPGTTVHTNPLDPDTDGDTRLDGDERANGGDPTDPNDPDDFKDSDRDGLTDAVEESQGWFVLGSQVFSNKFTPDTDFDGLPDLLEREIGSNPTVSDTDGDGLSDFDEFGEFAAFIGLQERFPGFVLDGTDSLAIGSDPLDTDTDGDGLTDDEEALGGWRVLVGGQVIDVTSSPLFADTDLDGADDQAEREGEDGIDPDSGSDNNDALDPRNPDTDGDGSLDGSELVGVSDPLIPDVGVTVRLVRLENITSNPDGTNNEWRFDIDVRVPSQNIFRNLFDTNDMSNVGFGSVTTIGTCPVFTSDLFSFTTGGLGLSEEFGLPIGSTIVIDVFIAELDECSASGGTITGGNNACFITLKQGISSETFAGTDLVLLPIEISAENIDPDTGAPACSGTFQIEIEVD